MKKLFILFFALITSISTIFAQSGTCGDNLTWDLKDGVLTISGSGSMKNWSSDYIVPWYSIRRNITSVIIDNSVTNIGSFAFGYIGLTSVTIGNSVIRIGGYAFTDCFGLTSVTIPNSVTSIGYRAFHGCFGLTSLVVENGNTVYDSRNNCNAIIETLTNTLIFGCKNTIIPNSVTSIGSYAFSECSGLTNITIPNSVTSIGSYAFSECSGLTNIIIPNSVTNIGSYAFSECSGLTSITCNANVPPACEEYAFYHVKKSIPIYVPSNSVEEYKTADGWKEFNIVGRK